jgi:hypothetical protein
VEIEGFVLKTKVFSAKVMDQKGIKAFTRGAQGAVLALF